jgi:hypothetical protein
MGWLSAAPNWRAIIENTHEALRKMVLDLESLDATIVEVDPDFQVETIKPKAFRPPKDWSNRGQM